MHCPEADTRKLSFTQCSETETNICHTSEHIMQCPETDTDVTQENITLCNVQKDTLMSHKRTQLHAMSRIRYRCHTREHSCMPCPETDTTSCRTPHKRIQLHAMSRNRHHVLLDATQENTTSGKFQERTEKKGEKPLPEADTTVLFTRPTRTQLQAYPRERKNVEHGVRPEQQIQASPRK